MNGISREPVNGRVHLAGALLAAVGLAALAVAVVEYDAGLVPGLALVVFGVSLVLMFACSALYHLSPRSSRSRALRRLDHAMIYVLIAGTYTPVCLVVLGGRAGWALLLGVWSMAGLGIALKACWLDAPRLLSTALYVGMGWIGLLAAPVMMRVAPPGLLTWLLAGGVCYTVGACFYSARWPRGVPGVFGFHELWHLFVIAGGASHYWAMFRYVAPMT